MLPSYKEAENLKKVLPNIHSNVSQLKIEYEVLVIDTIEKMDDTENVCVANRAQYITRENGNLYGDAIRTGINKANGKYLVIMDADGSHEPRSIIDLYKTINENNLDIVIGSRYVKGGLTENNQILILMSWLLNITYRLIFKLKVKDCSNSFRIYNLSKLKTLKLECNNFDIVEEILIKLNKTFPGLKIKEIKGYQREIW